MFLTPNIHKVKKSQSADVLSKMHSKIGINAQCHGASVGYLGFSKF